MTRIAIIGPGAIGGTVAAWLAQDPANEVILCARTPLDGLRVEAPEGAIEAQVPVLTDPAEATAAEWVLVCTKTYDVAGAAAWFGGLVAEGTRIAILQNGVEHVALFAPYAAREGLLPAVVNIPAERLGPGRVLQRLYGTIAVPSGEDGDAFAALFANARIKVSTSDDFVSAAWEKLTLNCTGAVNALVLKPNGVVHDEAVAALMKGLMAECIAVGRAEGATLADDLADRVIALCRSGLPDSVNSMHADRLAGRPMEIDARNGVIVRRGRKHGIETPLNALVVTLLEAAQG
jgi:2-dehydropantoate 2-reductase